MLFDLQRLSLPGGRRGHLVLTGILTLGVSLRRITLLGISLLGVSLLNALGMQLLNRLLRRRSGNRALYGLFFRWRSGLLLDAHEFIVPLLGLSQV